MANPTSLRPEELSARSYADRLILQELTTMEGAVRLGELAEKLGPHGLGLDALKSLLATNSERFAYHDRKWIPTSRIESAEAPFVRAIQVTLERFGGPMPIESLAQELSWIRPESQDWSPERLIRIIKGSALFLYTDDDQVALAEWAFQASGETLERAYALNQVDAKDVEAAAKKLSGVDWRAKDSAVQALKAAAPMSAKILGAVAWLSLNPQDPKAHRLYDAREFFSRLIAAPGFVYGGDGVMHAESDVKGWITSATKVAQKLAPSVQLEDAAPIEVKAADIKEMTAKILGAPESITVTKLLEETYEITPMSKTFPDDMANVVDALRESGKVWWVGGDRFRKPESAPDFIYSVPDPFQFVVSSAVDEEGEPIDVELTDEGLSTSLRKLLTHPLATDVLDEDSLPAPKTMPATLRLVLKSIHRELGTFPLCQMPTGFLGAEPKIQELIFIDTQGRELQAWANLEARLLYNLIDWWFEQPVESGAVFNITKTDRPNVFEFAWEDQADPLLFISPQRMEQLREIQSRSDGMSTKDVLIEVMAHWHKGADFLTILAEVNVIRRSTRRLVASLLSSYQCFYQRSGSPVWHYDGKKVDLGFDKTKKKFIKK